MWTVGKKLKFGNYSAWTYHLDQDYDSKRIILRNIMTTMYYLEEDYDN